MEAQFACPHCQQLLSIDESYYGGQVLCPHCNGPFLALRPGSHMPAAVAKPISPAPHPSPAAPAPPRPAAPAPRPAGLPSRPTGAASPGGPARAKPGAPRGPMPVSSSAAEAALAAQEERKAKMLIGGMFAGGVVLLAGLLYLGSRFLDKSREENSTLEQVSAINASRAKEEDARRERRDADAKDDEDKRRAEEVDRVTKILSLNVCDGDDQVAGELAKTLVSITEDLRTSFQNGNLPKNLPAYVEQKLVTQMTENATLRHWFGKRSPQVFAHTVATMMFGSPASGSGNRARQGNPMPAFLDRYASMGSGFFVSADGLFLTNQHVVKNSRSVDVRIPGGKIVRAKVLKTNPSADIALLKADVQDVKWLPVSKGPAPMGAPVFTIGFPQPTLQGIEPKFTDGRISSLSGMRDDAGMYQISVPLQSGNSGGPLVHADSGWIVGIVCAKLNSDEEGDILQNVNYAIKSTVVRDFLGSIPEARGVFDTPPELPKSQPEVIDLVKSAIGMVLVEPP